MGILDRLFGTPKEIPEVQEQANAIQAAQETLAILQEKLALDPCAADPTREECAPEVKQLIRSHPDVARTLLSSRDTWRARP